MTNPFPVNPIYDQLLREQEERDRPPEPTTEPPAETPTEEPSA